MFDASNAFHENTFHFFCSNFILFRCVNIEHQRRMFPSGDDQSKFFTGLMSSPVDNISLTIDEKDNIRADECESEQDEILYSFRSFSIS